MTKFRHLIWMLIATGGLILVASQSNAQMRQPDVGDQPGLVADDSVELDPQYRKTAVLYRTSEAPGTIIVVTAERHLYLVQGAAARCATASASPRGFHLARAREHHAEEGMAGLDATAGNDSTPALSAALHGRRPR